MTDLQKEKAIHDYLVLHLAYDVHEVHISQYDALTLGITVCQGYTMLAYKMLQDAGIPVHIVTGTSGGVAHTWNLVQLQGHWYHLDVTFDDPVPDQPGKVHYGYFNLTDAQIARNHVWSQPGLPAATTDFVGWLTAHAADGSATAAGNQELLVSTGLYLETPRYTYTSPAQLQQAVNAAHGCTLRFRYPFATLSTDIEKVTFSRGYRATFEQDMRAPAFALVTISFGC